uniref:Putative trypsin-like peptidase domain containing protein n=1 Tax=viral metagenome TaxID=1070528 RepID=A0A6H1ZLC8_9ZZZZ
MKKLFLLAIALSLMVGVAGAAMTGLDGHKAYIYPVVRVTCGYGGGSGTVVYSKEVEPGKFSTYVLTNHHVIADAINITEEWDSALAKNIPVERRSVVYVEQFKYRDISIPVGTMRIEADIKVYNKQEDMALLRLRYDEPVGTVAKIPRDGKDNGYRVLDEAIAVGCSLLFPPLPTVGKISRMDFLINSLPYHMSSAQIIYGNSGGAMFTADGTLIGIPSMIAVTGWMGSVPIPHMGLFIPIDRVYRWLKEEKYDFVYDPSIVEKEALDLREKEIKKKRTDQKR